MTTVAILPENPGSPLSTFRAIAGNRQSTGKTAGEALDAIAGQLDSSDPVTLVVLHHARPDRFFTAEQQARLADLMGLWRQARDTGQHLPEAEQRELDALVEAELRAASARATALVQSVAS